MSAVRTLVIVAVATVSRSLAFPSIFSTGEAVNTNPSPFKGFSGLRAFNRSARYVYWHDQTIGVVELGPKRLLLNCELVEVYEPEERFQILHEVSDFAKPHRLSFEQMLDLMGRCSRLETPPTAKRFTAPSQEEARSSSLFNGVIPGTKWCGTGDIAATYFDLGEEESIDRCCRTHDLCPSKVRGNSVRYNLTNENMYTKSHCRCDLEFQKCLRQTRTSTADIMGHFFFDLLKIPCIRDTDQGSKVIGYSPSYAMQ